MIFHAIILMFIIILQDLNYFIHIIENICLTYTFYVPTDSLQNESCHKFMHICCSKIFLLQQHNIFILEMDRTVSY